MSAPKFTSLPEPTQYRRDPADFKPWELAAIQWFRCKQRKQCFCCDRWLDVGVLYGVVTRQAVCRRCYSAALQIGGER